MKINVGALPWKKDEKGIPYLRLNDGRSVYMTGKGMELVSRGLRVKQVVPANQMKAAFEMFKEKGLL